MRNGAKFFAMAGVAMILLLSGAGLRAQDAASAPPPPPVAGHGHGPGRDEIRFLGFEAGLGEKTVTGAPFSASFSTESTETLADGNQIKHTSTGSIARDAQGRTRRDMTWPAFGPMAVAGQAAPPHVTFVNDPVAGTRYILEADTKTARQMPPPPDKAEFTRKGHAGGRGAGADAADKEAVITSLGTQTIGGVAAEGTRYTRTIPAGQIGNVKPIVIVTERWYSADLQMVVMTKRSDPRSGDTVFQMISIARTEPAASLFQVPADYTVAQATPHVRHAVRMAGPPPAEE
jgi:hypothetical protein